MTIAAIILAHNEAHRIEHCLKSLSWVDDVLVVDGFSTDGTVDLARELGARVIQSDLLGPKNPGGYAAQRNFALGQVSADWVVFIDADERCTSELAAEIRAIISQNQVPFDGFRVRRKEHFFGVYSPFVHGESWLTRLAKREKCTWNPALVHESLVIDGSIGSLDAYIEHHSKASIAEYVSTQNRYTTLEAQQAALEGRSLAKSPLPQMIKTFCNIYIYKGAYREGSMGFVFAVLFAHYSFLCWAKHWEIEFQSKKILPAQPRFRWSERVAALMRRIWHLKSPPTE